MIQSTLQREIPHLRREGSALNNTKSSETASNTDNARNPTTQNLPRWFRRKTFSPETVASESLEDQANILSQWFLTFLTPLLKVGSRQTLEDADVGVPSRGDRAAYVYETIRKEWVREIQVTNEKNTERRRVYISKRAACQSEIKALEMEPFKDLEPSLRGPLLRAFGRYRIVLAFIYYSLSVLLGFVPIIVLSRLVRWLEDEKPIDEYSGISSSPWIDSAVIGTVAYISSSLLKTRHHVIMTHCSIFVRTGVSMLLYRKGLRISAAARQKMSTGQVVNLMSNDAVQLQRYLKFGGMTIVAPIEIILAFFLVFQQVGNAAWVGVAFMVLLSPINLSLLGVASTQRKQVIRYSDLRVKLMNEIIAGIRVIKFYAWERPFGTQINTHRDKELKALTKMAYSSTVALSLILGAAPLILPVLVFFTYTSLGNDTLSASTAFTTIALFNIMRFPFAFLPMGLAYIIQGNIAIRRIEKYLNMPELVEYVEPEPPIRTLLGSISSQKGTVTIQNGSFSWADPEAEEIIPLYSKHRSRKELEKHSRRAPDEKLLMKRRRSSVWNPEGHQISQAERTHMKQSAMDNHVYVEGLISSVGNIASVTLRNLDLKIETGSLVAVIGPVNSGKSSLLSAILGELEPIGNSRIYVPHSVSDGPEFLSYSSQASWLMNDTLRENVLFGRPFDSDRYWRVINACCLNEDFQLLPDKDMTEIGENGISLSGGQKARISLARALYSSKSSLILLDDPLSALDTNTSKRVFRNAIKGDLVRGVTRILVSHNMDILDQCDKIIVMDEGGITDQGTYFDLISRGLDLDVKPSTASDFEETNKFRSNNSSGMLGTDDANNIRSNMHSKEERHEGRVSKEAYSHYVRVGGRTVMFSALAFQALTRGTEIGAGFWLALWSKRSFHAADSGEPMTNGRTNFYLIVYAAFGTAGIILLSLKSVLLAVHRLRASKKLHNDLTATVLRAPVSFFDVTTAGRILNRFAADMDIVDIELAQNVSQGIVTFFSVAGAIVTIVITTKGTFLALLIPLALVYSWIQNWFQKTSTELQRLNQIANSFIFSNFSETLTGTSTIRAFRQEARLFKRCMASFDRMNASYQLREMANSWLGIRLDVLGSIMGVFIAGVAIATRKNGFIPASWTALSLSTFFELTNFLKFSVRTSAVIEANMTSVDRIKYYTESIAAEAPQLLLSDPDQGDWPSEGRIKFSNVTLRYLGGPEILQSISFAVNSRERIGICGRTGSGKSSIAAALFRIYEIETNGTISIDDRNIRMLGLDTLRSRMAVIPQEPVLFSTSIRYNLDPFGQATDQELWDVLRKVQMIRDVASLPDNLDEPIFDGGGNFSRGQKQLLCIARVLLRKPKIVVMDEATSSIDNETDELIQAMLRDNFADATVLMIAHRLNTILDSDRVLVLDNGSIMEYDRPGTLLRRPTSLFNRLVQDSHQSLAKSAAIMTQFHESFKSSHNDSLSNLESITEELFDTDGLEDELDVGYLEEEVTPKSFDSLVGRSLNSTATDSSMHVIAEEEDYNDDHDDDWPRVGRRRDEAGMALHFV